MDVGPAPSASFAAGDTSADYALWGAEAVAADPTTYNEAMASANASQWAGAVDAEYQALVDSGTVVLSELPADRTPVGSR